MLELWLFDYCVLDIFSTRLKRLFMDVVFPSVIVLSLVLGPFVVNLPPVCTGSGEVSQPQNSKNQQIWVITTVLI